MSSKADSSLFTIVAALQQAGISFSIETTRDDALTVVAAVPGQRWEIDVHNDGEIDFEIFQSDGKMLGVRELEESISQWAEPLNDPSAGE